MNPKDYRYTKDHEWIFVESGNTGKIGLADYAQSHLGDLVYFDLPPVGTRVAQGEKLGEVESVKAISDIFSPATGEVIEVNQDVIDTPKLANEDPYGKGWLVRIDISDLNELDNLMGIDAYEKYVEELTAEN